MKNLIFTLSFLTILLQGYQVKAQTLETNNEVKSQDSFIEISGPQYGVWTTGSEYHVIGYISVPRNQILVIEPGVTIKFMDRYAFTIYGILYAEGTETDSIVFTSGQVPNSNSDWWGINIGDTASSDTSSIISYSRIEYASTGISCWHSNTIISNNLFYNDSTGINIEGGGTISNNTFNKNGWGIVCYESTADITNNKIVNNSVAGIECIVSNDSLTIMNNEISNNGLNIMSTYYGNGIGCYNSSPLISNNAIANNYYCGIYCSESSSPMIANNIIEYNGYNWVGYGNGILCDDSSPYIGYNTINNNDWSGIECTNNSVAIIEYNIFFSNRWSGIECSESNATIKYNIIYNDSTAIWLNNSSPTIRNNTIANNSYGGIINNLPSSPAILNNLFYKNTGFGAINGFSGSPTELEFNLFYENSSNFSGDTIPLGFEDITIANTNGDSCDIYYNLFMDPMLSDAANFNFHLLEDSPCINAGNPNPAYYDPDGTISDIGALYFQLVGIESNEIIDNKITIYPNPSKGLITISSKYIDETIQVAVFDIRGIHYKSIEIEPANTINSTQFDLRNLSAGVYFLHCSSKSYNTTKKIIIRN